MLLACNAGIAPVIWVMPVYPSVIGWTVVRWRDTMVPCGRRKKVVAVSAIPPSTVRISVKQRVAVPIALLSTGFTRSTSKQFPWVVPVSGTAGMVRVVPMALPFSCTMSVRLSWAARGLANRPEATTSHIMVGMLIGRMAVLLFMSILLS